MELVAIATLEDALAYPQQPALLGPLRPPLSAKVAASAKKRKPRIKKSALTPHKKKFPPALARFRDRLQCLEERLRLDVNALRQEVHDLTLHRSLLDARALSTRYSADGAASRLVREYFVVFAHGFQRFPTGADDNYDNYDYYNSVQASERQLADARSQQAFLTAAVDPELTFHRFVGRAVLVEQWQRYSQCHAGLQMHLHTLAVVAKKTAAPLASTIDEEEEEEEEDDAVVAVHATGHLTAHVTHETLAQIFPHVLRNTGLACRLLGAAIVYPFRIEFHFKAASGGRGGMKMTKYDADVDFVAALSGVLGNLDDVTLLMRDALISEYCMIGRRAAEEEAERLGEADAEAVAPVPVTARVSKAAIDYILS